MSLTKLRVFFFLLLLATPSVVVAAPACRFVFANSQVWQVCTDGQVELVPLTLQPGETIRHIGTTNPVPSPDGRWVAFTRKGDLWVLEGRTGKQKQLTHIARQEDPEYVSVYVHITAWSPNSQEILFHVSHNDMELIESEDVARAVPPVPYGYRVSEVFTGAQRRLLFPGEFEAWLPDNEFILTSAEEELLNQRLLHWKAGEEIPGLLSPLSGSWGQVNVRPDGRAFLVALSYSAPVPTDDVPEAQTLRSRLLEINLDTGRASDATPNGTWAEYQSPLYSPSGRRRAYLHQLTQNYDGTIHAEVVVDGHVVWLFNGYSYDFRWLNDQILCASNDYEVILIQVDTGTEISRHSFEPVSTTRLYPSRQAQ